METQTTSTQTKKCPKCKEVIQKDAKKCRYCQADLRNWFLRHKIISVIILLLLLGFILESGKNGKNDNKNKEKEDTQIQTPVESKQNSQGEKKIYKSGEPVQIGYFIYMAGRAREMEEIKGQYSSEKADGIFEIISVVATNIDKEPRYLDDAMFRLVDNQNRSYMTSPEGTSALSLNMESAKNLFLKPVNPSLVTDGVLVFDVPKNAEGLMLEVSGSFGSPEKKYIDLESAIEGIETERVSLGVRYAPVDATIQADNNLPYAYGAFVVRGQNTGEMAVVPDSPADKAGIKENDIILEVDGVRIVGGDKLTEAIGKHKIGDEVRLKVWRKGEGEKELLVTLTQIK
jgi:hypothetical protein